MNDTMTEKLMQYINVAEDFIVQDLPIFMEEILNYKFYENLVEFVIFIAFILVGIFVFKKVSKFDEKKIKETSDILIMFFLIVFVVGFFGALACISDMIKLKMAPRLYLVEIIKGK